MSVKKININQTIPTYDITSDVGYLYAGVATPTTDPGTPDGKVVYFASTPGTYQHFDNIAVEENQVVTLYNINGSWESHEIANNTVTTDKIVDGAVTTKKLSTEVRLHSTDELMLPITDLLSLPSQCTITQTSSAFNLSFYTISGKVRLVGTCTEMSLYVCIRNNAPSADVIKRLSNYEGDFDVTIDLAKELNIYPMGDLKYIEIAINSKTDCTINVAYATSDIVSDIIGQKKYNIYTTYTELDFSIKQQLVFPNGELGSKQNFNSTHLLEIPEKCVFMSVKDVYIKQYYDIERTQYAFGGISLFDVDKNFISTILEQEETLVDLREYPEARYIQVSHDVIKHPNPKINFLTDSLVAKLTSDNKDLVNKMNMTLSYNYNDMGVYGWNNKTTIENFYNTHKQAVATVKNSATNISGIIKSITVTCANSGTMRFCVGFLDQRSWMIPSHYFEIEAQSGYHTYDVSDKSISILSGQQLFVYVGIINIRISVLGYKQGNKSYNLEHEMIYGIDTGALERLPLQYGGFICLEYTVLSINSIFSIKSETEALKSQIEKQNKIIEAQQFVYDNTGNAYEIKVINGNLVAKALAFKNVQIFGNSLTNHGYFPSIGWYGSDEWAMAASTREMGWNKRFLNILKQKQPEAKLRSFNIATWERTPSDYLTEEAFVSFIAEAEIDIDVDLFVFKAGENNSDTTNFEKALDVMVSYLGKTYPKATILMCTCFWSNAAKDAAIANIANKYGTKYLTSTGGGESELLGDMTYGEEGELHPIIHGGVAGHVSDYGFYLWANKLAEFFGYTPDTDNYNINITATVDYRILRTTKPAGGVVSILVQTETQPSCNVTKTDGSEVTVTWHNMADVQWQSTPSYKPTYVATFTMPNQDVNVTLNS